MPSGHIYCLSTVDLDRVFEIDHLPAHDEKIFAATFSEGAGGQGVYVGRALAALGAPATFVTVVGDDAAGIVLADELSRIAGLTIDMTRISGVGSGTCVILVDGTGEKAIILAPRSEMLTVDLGRRLEIGSGDIVAANFYHPDAIQDLFGRARQKDCLSILDLETPGISRWGWPASIKTLESAAIICSNRVALEHWALEFKVSGSLTEKAHRFARFLAGDDRRACVTLGDQGVIAIDSAGIVEIPAIKVKPRNTTGAGDSFLAGLAFALHQGRGFADAAEFGTRVAADFLVHGAIDPDRLATGKSASCP